MEPMKDGIIGRRIYAAVLRGTRYLRRLKRKVLGPDPPEWLSDLSDLLGSLNLLGILPTMVAILLAPNHFFRRVRPRGQAALAVGQKPVKFFFQCAALVALLNSVYRHDALTSRLPHVLQFVSPKYLTTAEVGLAVVVMPLCLILLGIFLEILMVLVGCTTAFALLVTPFAILAAIHDNDPSMVSSWLWSVLVGVPVLMLIPWKAARRCRRVRFNYRFDSLKARWSYFYLATAFFAFCSGIIWLAIPILTSDALNVHSDFLQDLLIGLFLLLFLFMLRVLVGPYVGMLDSASLYPGRRYYIRRVKSLDSWTTEYTRHLVRQKRYASEGKHKAVSRQKKKVEEKQKMVLEVAEDCLTEIRICETRWQRSIATQRACREEMLHGLAGLRTFSAPRELINSPPLQELGRWSHLTIDT